MICYHRLSKSFPAEPYIAPKGSAPLQKGLTDDDNGDEWSWRTFYVQQVLAGQG